MKPEPDYIVEIDGRRIEGPTGQELAPNHSAPTSRPWISVLFECCSIYQRIYRNPAGTAYKGHCPRCLRPITIKIAPNGSPTRSFRAH